MCCCAADWPRSLSQHPVAYLHQGAQGEFGAGIGRSRVLTPALGFQAQEPKPSWLVLLPIGSLWMVRALPFHAQQLELVVESALQPNGKNAPPLHAGAFLSWRRQW